MIYLLKKHVSLYVRVNKRVVEFARLPARVRSKECNINFLFRDTRSSFQIARIYSFCDWGLVWLGRPGWLMPVDKWTLRRFSPSTHQLFQLAALFLAHRAAQYWTCIQGWVNRDSPLNSTTTRLSLTLQEAIKENLLFASRAVCFTSLPPLLA